MSAIKKQSKLRWTATSERTAKGLIWMTTWKTVVGKYHLTIENYPGTRTLSWAIELPETGWRTRNDEDRFEFTVARLKDTLEEKALEYARQDTLRNLHH